MNDILTKRPISHTEAKEIAGRLINSHFRQEPHARASIPSRPDYDDDLLILAYIAQREAEDGDHDRGVSDLLAANNREVERRREAEAEIGRLRALLLRFATDAFAAQQIGMVVEK